MSRIHEALQQAEKDKNAGVAWESAAVVAVASQAPSELPKEAEPTLPAAADGVPLAEIDAVPENGAGNGFLARCPRPTWTPDLKSMLFFGSEGAPGGEEFRTLRSGLYRAREKQPVKSVLVTSALPGEGKSFIAANLAQVIACQHGRRVLLIDADLRRPRLHVSLGAPPSPGLADYLKGTADEMSVIQQAPLEGLFFIPGGTPASNPAELIAGPRMPVLLSAMTEYFDWIIIDCPPCIPVADASILAAHCDGVLFVVQAGTTPPDLAKKAKQQFKGKSVLGVVLNRVSDPQGYGSYYYGAYGANAQKAAMSK